MDPTRMIRGPRALILLALVALVLYLPGLAALPVTDRDEARFAQATRQMVETGDYLHIRFQGEPRNKKPAGIHWLQAASLWALAGGKTGRIWAYRVPSVLGALAAVAMLFALARPVIGFEAAWIAALALASSLLLAIEAHIAKTDAVLLATVVAAEGALLRLYDAARSASPARWGPALLFWGALGAGILIKGPVTPLIAALTLAALMVADRRTAVPARLWGALHPLPGIALAAAIAAPWFVIVSLSDGGFIAGAIKGDLLPKLIGGQESHGAWPGTYLALAPVTFWPASLLAPLGLVWCWRHRDRAAPRLALAWLIPAWALFELVPTKLPHYVLPLYPALAVMIGIALTEAPGWIAEALRSLWGRAWIVLWALVGAGLAALVAGLALRFGGGAAGIAAAAAAVISAGAGALAAWRGRARAAVIAVAVLMVPFVATTFAAVLPRMAALWPAASVQTLVRAHQGTGAPAVAAAGYHEPSLVFALGTATVLTDGAGAARHLAAHPGALAVVEAREDAGFRAALGRLGLKPVAMGAVFGFNTARGKTVKLTVYRTE